MTSDAFMHVRAALGAIDNSTITDPNTTGSFNLSAAGDIGGVEVEKMIDRIIVDGFSRDTEFRQLIRRSPIASGIVASWIIKTGTGTKADFYSEGAAGTPAISTKIQLTQLAKALRSDYEVSGLLIAGGFYDVLGDEAKDAVTDMNLKEEKQMVNGTDASAGGDSAGYPGLLQLMLDTTAHGDTTTIYGVARSATNSMSVQDIDAGVSGTSTGVLDLADLDGAITGVEKQERAGRKIFLCSFERADEVNQLLQPQQRFQGSIEIAAGFRVMTYRGIPVIRSKRMAYNGVTNTGSSDNSTNLDNAMYLLSVDSLQFKTVGGVDQIHVPISGAGDSTNYLQRADVQGGYFKTYGCMVLKRFDNQSIIWNLTAP